MSLSGPELNSIVFRLFTSDEIRSLSVLEIITPLSFNHLDHPLAGGLYDLRLGPSGMSSEACLTCKNTTRNCPGHFGHIELPVEITNPLFHKEIAMIIGISCTSCYKLIIPPHLKYLLIYQLKLLDAGFITEAQELETIVMNFQSEQTPDAALGFLVRDEILKYVNEKGFREGITEEKSTKTTESLRRHIISNVLKQVQKPKNCPNCKVSFKRITSYQNKLITAAKVEVAEKFKDSNDKRTGGASIIFPKECKEMLQKIYDNESEIMLELLPVLKNTGLEYPVNLMFMDVILVPPPKTRPVNFADGKMIENSQTRSYKTIINDCIILKHVTDAYKKNSFDGLTEDMKAYVKSIKGQTALEKFHQCWLELQSDIDHLLDADMNKTTGSTGITGLKQIFEKKEGIIRMHMMGKRVNFAARSVITPDPNLQIQEIGIPEYFAKRLTYPVRVTFFNVEELRKMVKNGPEVYPGATMIENENGSILKLFPGKENKTKRDGASKLLLKSIDPHGKCGKIVHRHLMNGDMLLLNRQPTLHRPSIMAHKARILKGEKTLRMHYSNCKSYNADFDGDEMNAHFPQNELARSEAYNMVNVANHYLVPKDGTPLGGLIQDHVIAGVKLTVRGQFFGKVDYHQLVYQALAHKPGNIRLLPPTILKPRVMWSGKQIISTILINIIPEGKKLISLNASAKIGVKSWVRGKPRKWLIGEEFKDPKEMSESIVTIRNGELIEGVLDKQHYGATPYGLTHCLFELYGGQCSSGFLDSIGRLFTYYLQLNGFTIGVEDILVLDEPDLERKEIIKNARKIGDEAAKRALDLEEIPNDLTERLEKAFFNDKQKFRPRLDQEYKKILDEYTNNINKVCLPTGLVSQFPDNNLQLMVTSGAKGSTVNTMQISCLLGQIELEGKRPPWMINGKSLPSFKPFETAPVAGGYIDGRFMTGINPQDFFFHCMAGREGLIDTAVKTSRSGYLQRCLIKHLEGITVCYDGTVRDHDGSVIQYAYGEDGIEVQKSTFFKKDRMDFLYENIETIVDESIVQQLKSSTNLEEINNYKEDFNRDDIWDQKRVPRPFTRFTGEKNIKEKYFTMMSDKHIGRNKAFSKLRKQWKKLEDSEKDEYKLMHKPDPVTSKFRPCSDFTAISENLEILMYDYMKDRSTRKKEILKVVEDDVVKNEIDESELMDKINDLIGVKYMQSLCQPGEPVGLLAAQSIGEPSTQMTLNTFHFAGRGEMNVTLGIPRLREILMTASKSIKTPSMDIPLKKSKKGGNIEKRIKKLKKIFRRATIADVLEKITVDEKLQLHPKRIFTYTIRFQFLPHSCYESEFKVTPKNILAYMEKEFLISLSKEVRKLGKKYGDIIHETKEEKEVTKVEDESKADFVDAAGNIKGNVKGFGEEHESSDEEVELDDDDATKARSRSRHQENQDYEEPEDSEIEKSDDEDDSEDHESTIQKEPEEVIDIIEFTEEEQADIQKRQNLVMKTFGIVKNYKYDPVNEEWCEIVIGIPLTLSKIDFSTILKELCKNSVVYEIPKVKRAFAYEKSPGVWAVKTDGINFIEVFNIMHQYPKILDVNRIYSNDVYQISQTYGIEAAGRVIVKELKDVFSVYGITVDPRHLLLIADYMTHQGIYSPFNRTGMADSPSPFQQMSFESSIAFLKKALFASKKDDLQSATSRIMVGRYCASGTGCFDVINDPRSFSSVKAL